MILYFDNMIKDAPLIPGIYSELDKIRGSNSPYKFRSRLDVTLYTLASYTEIEWSYVIIKYQLKPENKEQQKYFESFVKKLFPKSKIIYGVSETQKSFQEMVNLINGLDDEWVFYAGNNDHPFMFPKKALLEKCLNKAKELSKKHKYVSIVYSHFPEPIHMARKGTTLHDIGFPSSKIIEETKDFSVGYFPRGYFTSIQIVNKNLLNYWLFSKDIGESPIWRIEEIHKFIPLKERKSQVVVLPKEEICAHFDGYSHTKGTGYFVPSSLVPPLFIPEGFFEKNIKIAYGYDDYKKGWVNINPLKNKFSFEDPTNGTDLKITLEDLPLFWKKRIKKIDINPKADLDKLKKARDLRFSRIKNLYLRRNLNNFLFYEFYISQFKIRYLIRKVLSMNPYLKKKIPEMEKKYHIKL